MKFKMLVIRGEPRGKCLAFPPGEFVIGRGSECHIRPKSDWVSRQHCLLRVTRGGAIIRDLGSTNGTLVNGVRVVGERKLIDGDHVQLGPLVFEARLEESILTPKAATVKLAGLNDAEPQDAGTTAEVPALPAEKRPATPPSGRRTVPPQIETVTP